jgi:hypothetical protein
MGKISVFTPAVLPKKGLYITMNDIFPGQTQHVAIPRIQRAIVTQLQQVVDHLFHIDDLLQWVAQACTQNFAEVAAVQFWSAYTSSPQHLRLQLRALYTNIPSILPEALTNQEIQKQVMQVLHQRKGIMPQSASDLFSPYAASLLEQYGLSHWACYFLSNSALLPPPRNASTRDKAPMPLVLAISLYFQQSPPPRLMPAISIILEQSIMIAKRSQLVHTS